MLPYVLSPKAKADLSEIWDYSADRWGAERATDYVLDIRRAIERAAAHPLHGRACDEVRAGYFKVSVGSHIVFYRLVDEMLDVVRVLHQRMDIGRHL
ncbi:type II toxin-antitoxin system RelE/ParE family toxin [Phenylobacterium sp.]|uniref:type II toxin-antitoxin system RelE/ParE family toxin n=1 Tax=Phenylobacterium sp. TaxID=1871053 RepID=UPI00289E2176|nr:type II toxin-antitoxin system RelE/ParE family toxin [Phenylobacterium sp.]